MEKISIIRVLIDYGNHSDTWWYNGGRFLWDKYSYTKDKYGYLNLNPKKLREFIEKAEQIRGWYTPLNFNSPYPFIFQDEDGNNIKLEDIKNNKI